MIPVACLTLVVVLLLALLLQQMRAHAVAEAAWSVERRELCSRIQAPERVPVEASGEYAIPEREADDWNKVGSVDIDPRYGLDDDGDGDVSDG